MASLVLLLVGPASAACINLGTAAAYAGANLPGTGVFNINGATIVNGDVYVGDTSAYYDLSFTGGSQLQAFNGHGGTIFLAPNATMTATGGSTAAGGQVLLNVAQSNQVVADLNTALADVAALAATQTLGAISGNATITSTTQVNVIDLTSVTETDGGTLTFSGSATDCFIVRVSGDLLASGASNIDSDGVGPANLLFVVQGYIKSTNSSLEGTYISTGGAIVVSGGDQFGAFIQAAVGKNLIFESGATIYFNGIPPTGIPIPLPASVLLLGSGLLRLVIFRNRKRTPGN
ncbi:MAG: hypothetical protein ACOZFS_16475 [Thermodesulfobacteriota bacterium]